jgi:hypothetical protein
MSIHPRSAQRRRSRPVCPKQIPGKMVMQLYMAICSEGDMVNTDIIDMVAVR